MMSETGAAPASYDAIVVGGGPAGSTCARQLSQGGMRVALVDGARFPRDKICAGWITPAVVQELALDLEDYAASRVLQPITGFRCGVVEGGSLQVDYPEPVSFGIRRCEFDHYLLERSGASLHLGRRLRDLRREGDHWVLDNGLRAPLLIGAGGHFCPVARALGNRPGHDETIVAAQEVEFPMDDRQEAGCRVREDVPELYFCRDLKGYGWVFRKGRYLNIGLGREDNRRIGRQVAAFMDWLRETGRLADGVPVRPRGHAYILYGHTQRRLVADGAILIGDAAGLAYAQSGEGIRPAVESALLASRLVLGLNGDYRQSTLAGYEMSLQQRFGRRQVRSSLLPEALKQALGRKLLQLPWFAREVVVNRWFLHSGEAPMPGVAA